jgi:integrase
VSVLAYARPRPQEALALSWEDIGKRTLYLNANKTDSERSVRLLDPLRQDLLEWRMACGRTGDREPVFTGQDGERWTAQGYNQWRGRVFIPAVEQAGLPRSHPYALQLGHGPGCP